MPGETWAEQLPRECWCSSVEVSAPPASVSEATNLVRCLQGSDSAPVKTSYAVGKGANDVRQKPLVKVLPYSDLLPKHGAYLLLDGLPSKGI